MSERAWHGNKDRNDTAPGVTADPETAEASPRGPASSVALEHVTKSYGPVAAIKDLTLQADAGELLVLLADLSKLAAVDRDLDRYTLVGGGSIYPFAWSILLAARAEGLGGVMTTMATRREPEVKQLLGVPEHFAVAGLIALGRPLHQPTCLKRLEVARFTTLDRFDGPALDCDSQRRRSVP